MFTELATLLRKGDTLAFTVARESDTQLRVNIMPKLFTMDGEHGQDRKALNQPLSIVATPEELDSPAFHETLNRYTGSTQSLRHTIDEVEAAHKKHAEDKSSRKSAPAKSKPAEKKAEPKDDKEESEAPAAPAQPAVGALGI